MLTEIPSFLHTYNPGDKVSGPPRHMLPSKDEIRPSTEDSLKRSDRNLMSMLLDGLSRGDSL